MTASVSSSAEIGETGAVGKQEEEVPLPVAVDLIAIVEGREKSQCLGFELAISYLRQKGLSVAIGGYPDRGEEPAESDSVLRSFVGPLTYWHMDSGSDFERLKGRQALPRSGGVLLVGGDFASRHDHEVLGELPGVEAVIRGEVEATLLATVEACREGRVWKQEPGLTIRGDEGSIRNPSRPLLEDLDQLMGSLGELVHPGRSSQAVITSRGCNSDCQYCGLQTVNRREFPGRARFWRSRSASSVVDEIEYFYRAHGIKSFHFNSYVFFGYDEAGSAIVRDIAEGILERELDIEFRFVTLARDLYRNRELLPLLQRSGLSQVTLGVDSGLERALRLYRVEFSRREIVGSLQALAREKISFYTAFIFYDPYLSLEEVRDNLEFIRTLAPYYRHMGAPFAYFVDQQFLGTTLRVRAETPIYPKLVADGVSETVEGWTGTPRIGFGHSGVGRLFQIHQAASKLFLPHLRPLFFHSAVVERFPFLDAFPLDLLGWIVSRVEASERPELRTTLADLGSWIHERLSGSWGEMVEILGLGDAERKTMDGFFEGLKNVG